MGRKKFMKSIFNSKAELYYIIYQYRKEFRQVYAEHQNNIDDELLESLFNKKYEELVSFIKDAGWIYDRGSHKWKQPSDYDDYVMAHDMSLGRI